MNTRIIMADIAFLCPNPEIDCRRSQASCILCFARQLKADFDNLGIEISHYDPEVEGDDDDAIDQLAEMIHALLTGKERANLAVWRIDSREDDGEHLS